MTRDEALEELKIRLSDKYMLQHSIVSEAIMREFALYYHDDIDTWGMAGLLHDIDYERTINNPMLHGVIGADILENLDVDPTIVYCVRAHNDSLEIPRNRKIDKVLFLSDPISDLIIKSASKLPNKKISDVYAEEILKMLSEQELVGDAGYDKMKHLDELSLTLEKFIEISVKAMQRVPEEYLYAE
ncbi:HDIG domain-containing protein [Ruminiclostridium herbifermentans]|uniref:HDIG domain-containing protein n=1 Tax=Ruminiclostridium herbifermentans TaxID=2488810 RepID=A0A4U7JD69_9FIRM|nr:HDIG domain-containing metalloprotein [Ruminiclostridium herbifermentans]QNU67876.1 HDIG domain-containing protein [Ruminiclostridium herbifermentans]